MVSGYGMVYLARGRWDWCVHKSGKIVFKSDWDGL